MKKVILSLICSIIFSVIWANPIDSVFAKQIAINFYKYNSSNPNEIRAVLVKKYDAHIERLNKKIPLIYIFNINETEGFVLVSGDDAALPVLGYSKEGAFDADNVPINTLKWFEGYRSEIRYIVENSLQADNNIRNRWTYYERFIGNQVQLRGSVAPLLTTKWNQSPYYNALCPSSSVTGCVATAMAQVMKFHNHPAQGTGFHSYSHRNYGTLSANFSRTTYNWHLMPNSITSSNSAVATLMYHCGVSVDMNYSPQVSGAWVVDAHRNPSTALTAENALKTYFGYSSTLQGVLKSSYTNSQWINLMKTELNARRPILHAGFGSGGGHAFVCDGYDDNDYFHFNWGWGGQADGNFWNTALNPGSTGTGGGSGGYNSKQQIIIGVKPNTNTGGGTIPISVKMKSSIIVNPNPIDYQQSFTVTTNVINRATGTFYGDITAALFDADYNFVDYIQTLTESNGLRQDYSYTGTGLKFTNTGLDAAPGNYYVGIFVRPTGGEWSIVGNESTFANLQSVTIVNRNKVQLYAQLKTTPTTLTRNQPFTAWFDVGNFSLTAFSGKMSVDLHKLNGDHIQEIATISNLQLGVNNHYTNGLTFNSNGLDIEPGTYQVAAWMQRTGGEWELIGSTTSYFNPITVRIIAPVIQADIYESNNTETTPHNFSLNFTNNAATFSTIGSNTHNGNDYDYYRVNLPTGYSYSITSRVHDSYNSGNGQLYTNDVVFSHKVGNGSWSDAFDDLSIAPISVINGGYVNFWVSPFFLGETGTYLLDVKVTRKLSSPTQDLIDLPINIYPNPVKDVLNIEIQNQSALTIESIEIYDILGRIIKRDIEKVIFDKYSIDISNMSNGTYNIVLRTKNGVCNKKFIVHR